MRIHADADADPQHCTLVLQFFLKSNENLCTFPRRLEKATVSEHAITFYLNFLKTAKRDFEDVPLYSSMMDPKIKL